MSQELKKLSDEFPFPSYEDWKNAAIATLDGAPFEKKLITKTYEGIDLQPIYTKENAMGLEAFSDSLPGEFPYSRALDHLGYKSNPWEIAQNIEIPEPSAFNQALLSDLGRGQNSVVLSLDENFAINNDCVECGKKLHINDLNSLTKALDKLELPCVSLRFKSNPLGVELAGLLSAYCSSKEYKFDELNISLGISPLKQLKTTGKSSIPVAKLIDDCELLIKNKTANNGKTKIISIDGEAYLNSGSNSVQDIAFSISEAVYIIRELLHRGLDIDSIAQAIVFEFAIGPKFFTEISKFRAARIVWAKIIKEFGGNADSQKMIIHSTTSLMNKTKFDPNVNMLRGTTEALSAVLGGVQSISVGCYDEMFGISGEFSRRIARNIQSVIMHEAHITDTIDPAAGSWYLEVLTNQIANSVWDSFKKVEAEGGFLESLKNGTIQAEIKTVASARRDNIASRRDTLLGTNKYPNLIEKPIESLIEVPIGQFSKGLNAEDQKVKAYSSVFMGDRSKSLAKAAEAFAAGATINNLLKSVNVLDTDSLQVEALPPFRLGLIFEELRLAADKYKGTYGNAPEICLVNFGQLKEYKGRNDFSSDFFQVAGFKMVNTDSLLTPDEAVNAIASTDYPVYVICSTDDKYAQVVEEFASKFKTVKRDKKLILAGLPKDYVEAFKSAGVDDFIHIKTNIYDFLASLMKEIGILN